MANENTYDVIVIGGGAAGFFVAINIKEQRPDLSVLILEKTQNLLSKVKISGGGRCNVTHACFDHKELTSNYPRGEKELLGPFHKFYTGDTIAWFQDKGIELKTEDDGRMFPITNQSSTIVNCFLEAANSLGVNIKLQSEVVKIEKGKRFNVLLKDNSVFKSSKLVFASGGHPKMKHYASLKDIGHHIIPPIPSLFTFNLKPHVAQDLMGLSANVTVKIKAANHEEYGPLLFTHWGFSGPAILKLSAKAARFLHSKNYQFDFEISWLSNALDFISNQRKNQASKSVLKSKAEDMPKRLWLYILKRAAVNAHKNWADLTKTEIENLIHTLEHDLYQVNGKTTFKEEFVTCGGVDLKEINMKTMESKLIAGLYFSGEVINVDALTGGFNFQAAWTTAWLAAEAICSSKKEG